MTSEFSAYDDKFVSHLLEIINSAVLLVDSEDNIELANGRALRMFSASKEELYRRSFRSFFMPDDREIFYENILNMTKVEGEFEGEVMLTRPDGTSFIGLLSTALWSFNGDHKLVVTIHDISRLKSLERVLKRSERMAFLGRMLDDISHQIRNPVLAIGGFARRLANLSQTKKEYIDVILEEAARLELLLTTLNEFLQLPRPRLELVSVGRLLDSLETEISGVVLNYGVRWSFSCPKEVARRKVIVDDRILVRAFCAVIQNGCEALDVEGLSQDEKKIEMLVEPFDGEFWSCVVRVVDKGSGISPHILPHIFDPFFSTKTGHIGMGLTFARRILEEQGGDVTVESRLGEGTTASIFLPKDRRRELRTRKVFRSSL